MFRLQIIIQNLERSRLAPRAADVATADDRSCREEILLEWLDENMRQLTQLHAELPAARR